MARDFNGTTQYASVASNALWNGAQMSLSVWVYHDVTQGNFARAVDVGGYNTGGGFDVVTYSGGGNIASSVWEGTFTSVVLSNEAYSTGGWEHYVVTTNTTGPSHLFYRNATQVGSTNTSAIRTTGTQAIYLAAANGGGSNFLDGKIAELSIWNGYTLTGTDITNLQSGTSPMALGTTPDAYWRMDGSGSTEADLVASVTMTYTGSPGTVAGPTVDDPPASGPSIPILTHHIRQQS